MLLLHDLSKAKALFLTVSARLKKKGIRRNFEAYEAVEAVFAATLSQCYSCTVPSCSLSLDELAAIALLHEGQMRWPLNVKTVLKPAPVPQPANFNENRPRQTRIPYFGPASGPITWYNCQKFEQTFRGSVSCVGGFLCWLCPAQAARGRRSKPVLRLNGKASPARPVRPVGSTAESSNMAREPVSRICVLFLWYLPFLSGTYTRFPASNSLKRIGKTSRTH